MSTEDCNSNKRGAGSEPLQQLTKRQRCAAPSRADCNEDDEQQQQRRRNERRIAELERQRRAIEKEIAEDDGKIAELERARARKQRRREAVVAEVARLKQDSANKLEKREERSRRGPQNPQIAQAIRFLETGLPLNVLLEERFPDLIDDSNFWWSFLEAKYSIPLTAKMFEILFDKRPSAVLQNKALVLQLLAYDPRVYAAIPWDWKLKADSEILNAVLSLRPTCLYDVPGAVQLQNPHVVGKSLARLPLWSTELRNTFKGRVGNGGWNHRDVVLGWLEGGGDLHDGIPLNLRMDPEILFAALGSNTPASLQRPTVPAGLSANKAFILQAVEKNPLMLNRVAGSLRGDKDLAIAALSGSYGFLSVHYQNLQFIPDDAEARDIHRRIDRFWFEVNETIRQKLRARDIFVKLVLGNIDLSETKPSLLGVLNQGDETSLMTKQLIADYAGVPIGKELAKLRRARKNLAEAGIPWCD